ncbi:diguanylate cyclase domain-containing protein [Streptomyces sp. CA-135486]|uniref:diguanylate cyclase domain-containing protein n=1 Tax=Streptomyces sp. CA-135486 TaxID=3240049 RepID=UPI003D93C56D
MALTACALGGLVAGPGDLPLTAPVSTPAAQGVVAFSLFTRAYLTSGRVRLRLTLLGTSAVGGAVYEVSRGLSGVSAGLAGSNPPTPAPLFVMASLAIAAGMAVAGLVLAADGGGLLRRLLDGWMTAGSLFTVGWTVVLRRTEAGDSLSAGVSVAGRTVVQILVLGLLAGLWFAVRREERATVTVAAAGLSIMLAGDMLFLRCAGSAAWWTCSGALECRVAGLLIVAASPWMRGGGTLLRGGPSEPTARETVAALIPLIVCMVSMTLQALALRRLDVTTVAVSSFVVVGLGVRQAAVQADNQRLNRQIAARERYFRLLVQESSDVIMIAGPDGILRYLSPAVYPVLGHRPEDLLGTSLTLLVHPDDRIKLMSIIGRPQVPGMSAEGAADHVSYRLLAADGRWRHIESAISSHCEGALLSSRDVSSRAALHARLEHLAFHDALTGLPNRALFHDRVRHALTMRSAATEPPTVLFVDLDGFKGVNDSAGHAAGDELLVQTARRLRSTVRAEDTVARLGGDEFAALLTGGAGSEGHAREVAERLLHTLSQPYEIAGIKVALAASIGMAVADSHTEAEELIRNADLAMYSAKAAGKGCIRASENPRQSPSSRPAGDGN